MRKIQSKISVRFIIVVLIVALLIGFMGEEVARKVSVQVLETSMLEAIKLIAFGAEKAIAEYTSVMGDIANDNGFREVNASFESKMDIVQRSVDKYYMRTGGIASLDGNAVMLDGQRINITNEEFFKQAVAGNVYFSPPYINGAKNDMHIVLSAPIVIEDQLDSVLFFYCDVKVLDQIVHTGILGEKGSCYILDKNGTTIAYSGDQSLVFNKENLTEQLKSDPNNTEIRGIAQIEAKMLAKETGTGQYFYEGYQNLQSYAPINKTDGWSIALTATLDDFLQGTYLGITVLIGLSILLVIIGMIYGIYFGKKMATPIQKITKRIELLAQGDLRTEIPRVKNKDEIGILVEDTGDLLDILRNIIGDITHVLGEMSNGNMTVRTSADYIGDFVPIQVALNKIAQSLNNTLVQINNSSTHVSSGAHQVSMGAQSLAQGATEQSNAVSMLAEQISLVNEGVNKNAQNSKEASRISADARDKLLEGMEQMNKMLLAMDEISKSSSEINKIIKDIDDIAFQTNILSLNASVEAARAGEAGKGFAVVADEVRNLASKSAQSARNTSHLIASAISSVDVGSKVAKETAQTLDEVLKRASESGKIISAISDDSVEQAKSLMDLNTNIAEISNVVHSNTATSEQSAAASQELSGQAALLKELISEFKLSNSDK